MAETSCCVAVLAGGESRRMGRDKAHLPLGPGSLVERVLAVAGPLGLPGMLIANQPGPFAHLGLPIYPDLCPGAGPLGGLHAALHAARADAVLLLACDLPFVTTGFLRFLVGQLGGYQAVVPRSEAGFEPLCAVYTRSCLPAVERALDQGRRQMFAFFPEVDLRVLEAAEWRGFDPHGRLFTNLNTPEEYQRAREEIGEGR